MVDGQLLHGHFFKVVSYSLQVCLETLEGVDLTGDALREGAHSLVLDVSAGMMKTKWCSKQNTTSSKFNVDVM